MIKKVSVLTLSLVFVLESLVVEAAPRRRGGRNGRRAGQNSVASDRTTSATTTTNNTTPVVVETTSDVGSVAPVANTVVSEPQKNTAAKTTAMNDLQAKISAVQSSCSGIKSNLDSIFGLSVATTVSSGLGTVAAGGALATGLVKASTDKKIEKKENQLLESRTQNLSEDPEKLAQQIQDILPKLEEDYAKLQAEIEEDTKKSKTLGNVRTGLMAGATVTSAVSMGTSIGATVSATQLAEKMSECNKALSELKMAKSVAEAEEVEDDNASMTKAKSILGVCTGYDESNINSLKNLATANAIVSGIGTATAGAGTITSAMANSKKVREDNTDAGKKKEKELNLASNILAGVTVGTSGSSTVLSAVQISKAKKDSEMAEKCEAEL